MAQQIERSETVSRNESTSTMHIPYCTTFMHFDFEYTDPRTNSIWITTEYLRQSLEKLDDDDSNTVKTMDDS